MEYNKLSKIQKESYDEFGIIRPDEEQRLRLREYRKETTEKAKNNKSENRFRWKYLKPLHYTHKINFNRQRIRGNRIFDFRCSTKWIAVEVDGWYHYTKNQRAWDIQRDNYNYKKHWVLVIRVEARDAIDAQNAIERIKKESDWKWRRILLWIDKDDSGKWFYELIDELKHR